MYNYISLGMEKRRHKELQKERKAYNKHKKKRLKEQDSIGCKYMFQEFLVNCEDALALMVPAYGRIYRLAHNPNQDIDIYPTALWDYEALAPKEVESQQTIPPNSCLEDQQEQLREYTPSFNTSVDGVVKPFIDRFEKMKTLQQFLNFKNKKGSHIFAYDVNPEDGLMWVEPDGHVSFLPYVNFSLDCHFAEDFTPVPIDNYNKIIDNYIKK